MDITLTNVDRHEYQGHVSRSITVTVDLKTTASVCLSDRSGQVSVCCLNASHRTWRGLGRYFGSFAAARDGYKSTAMKVAIEEAERALGVAA